MSADVQAVAGLDIGTTDVCMFIGEYDSSGSVHVTGIGASASPGMRKGMVINLDATVRAIRKAKKEAEKMAGHSVNAAFASIGGEHVSGLNSHGNVALRAGEVGKDELDLALESARAVPLTSDEKILHVMPQEYVIDRQDGIKEPLGMSGTRLEANVHVVTCAKNAVKNISKCMSLSNLDVAGVVSSQIASASAVLSDDELDLGVCLIDIGGGTTEIAVYTDGAIRSTQVFSIAGDSVTKDIAMSIRTPVRHAEDLKIRYACASTDMVQDDEVINVPGVGDRQARTLNRHILAAVVESRYRELFNLVQKSLDESGFTRERLGSGVVLTGGAANMEGVTELAEEIFNVPVSLGLPRNIAGHDAIVRNSAYATSAGLLAYASKSNREETLNDSDRNRLWRRMSTRFGHWLKQNV